MSQSFNVNVNSQYDFEVSESDLEALDISEMPSDKHHVIYNKKSLDISIIASNYRNRTYKVKVNNNTYNINIFNDLDATIKSLGFEFGTTKLVNDIKAPMPGLILDIQINSGDDIKENDTLLILEAMKMENVITSPRDGIIKAIHVNQNDTVDKSDLLIEFE